MAPPVQNSPVSNLERPEPVHQQRVPAGVGDAPTTMTPPPREKGYVEWAVTTLFHYVTSVFKRIYGFFCSCFLKQTPPAAAESHLLGPSLELPPETLTPPDFETMGPVEILHFFHNLPDDIKAEVCEVIGRKKAAFWSVRSYRSIGESWAKSWVKEQPELLIPYLKEAYKLKIKSSSSPS